MSLRISRKAINEFRTLVAGGAELEDREIEALLDAEIARSQPLHRVTDGKHPEDLTSIYEICHGDAKRYAVVRDGCCVTLLVDAIVKRNLANGSWWVGARTLGAPPRVASARPAPAPLEPAGELANVPAVPIASPTLAPVPVSVPVQAPVPVPAAPATPVAREEIVSPIPLPLAAKGVSMVEAHIEVARARLALTPIIERVAAARAELGAARAAEEAAEIALTSAIDRYMEQHDAMEQAVEQAIADGQDR